MKRALLQRHIEEAESRIQRGQRNIDIQREAVSELERDNQDATIAKALLRMFEKALADKHGATVRDVTTAMLSIDDTLSDLLYDQERMLQHEIEDLTPV